MSAFLLSGKEGAITRAASVLKAQSPAEYAALLRMANGRIGRAIELLEEKKRAPVMARREAAAELCRLLATGKRQDALLPHLLSFGSSRDELTARLLSVSEALRDLIALERTEDAPLIFFTDRESAIDLSARFVCKDLFTFVEATQEALAALAVNANTRLVISQYLCRLTA